MEIILSTLALFALFVPTESQERSRDVQLDPRPFWLIDQMRPSTLKDQLAMCAEDTKHYAVSDFSIGHRGACLQFPEHTLESYAAALEMGAGIVECDVTFTKDRQLICRHSQCDLHTTTNVVTIPDLNAKCTTPWSAGVSPNCCASDFTLDEIKTLCAKMDSSGPSEAATAEEYAYGGTADWRTDLYQLESCPEVPTHKESIAFIKAGNGYFTPELKSPSVEMPYEGNYTQEMYAQQMIDEYVEAGVPPEQVWPQSFSPDDVFYWIDNTEFGAQAVALDDQYDLNTTDVEAFLDLLVSRNVKIVAPPMQRLVDPAPDSEYLMTASHYANAAKNRSLGVIAWTLERSGPGLTGFYWETLEDQVELNEGDRYNLLHVLLNEVEVLGVFSDWPATTTFFANCMGATLRSSPVMAAANDDRVGGIGSVQVGPRPYWLVEQMRPSALKNELVACADRSNEFLMSDFSIGHRGACLQFPEHTLESYAAALEMGAGIVECDVTFTKDRQLICRHSQCDLHTTTNVVTIPDLNAKCTTPWSAGVSPNCCASDFTLDEIKTLCAKMDSSGPSEAATAEEYAYGGTADWRTDLYQLESCPEVPTHKESIAFIKAGNGYFTPELKSPSVEMPYEGNYTQEMYAQQMIDEYVEAGVPPEQVWPQSFSPDDVFYWIDNTEFGAQAVALDDQYDLNTTDVEAFLDLLVSRNVKIVAPPMQRLVDPAPDSEYLMTASHYANAAKNRSLGVIAWTLERSGPGLTGFYWETLEDQVELNEGDRYNLLHVLLNEVEVLGVFSDWPATTTFFANCMGASLRTAEEIDVAVEGSNTSASAQVGSIVATITISALVHLLIFT